MVTHLPQEIEVWYLLPAMRRELARVLLAEHDLKQKEVAKLLGVTEAAISQYKKSKRAGDIIFDEKEREIVKTYADKMLKTPAKFQYYLYKLSQELHGCNSMCVFHKKIDDSVPKDCKLCKLAAKE